MVRVPAARLTITMLMAVDGERPSLTLVAR